MTVVIGIGVAALLFAVFTVLSPRDKGDGCTGNCVGCVRADGERCEREGARP